MTASITVKGMERVNRRSDKAKLKMKMFLAVLMFFFRITAQRISKLLRTKKKIDFKTF